MSILFVIPASPELARDVAELRTQIGADPKRSKALFHLIGNRYVDDVVNGLVLDFLHESRQTQPRMRSLIETLAGLIKTISHGLVGQAFAKLTPEKGAVVLTFIDERLCERPGGLGLGVPLDPSIAAGIDRAVMLAATQQLTSDRVALLATVQQVIDRAIDFHYKKPFSMLDLGFILRKGVDVGYDTIRSGAMSTMEKTVNEADEAELADLAQFFARRVVR